MNGASGLTIRRKMGLMLAVNALLVMGASWFTMSQYRQLLDDNRTAFSATQESLVTVYKGIGEVERFKHLAASKGAEDQIEAVKSLRQLRVYADDLIRQFESRQKSLMGDDPLFKLLRDSVLKLQNVRSRVDDAMVTGHIPAPQEWGAYLTALLSAQARQIERYQDDTTVRIDQRVRQTRILTLIAVLVFVACMIAFTSWIAWTIGGTTSRLAEAVSTIQREGDLTKAVYVATADEMGALAKTFNSLVGSLADIVRRIRGTADQVGGTVREFMTSATALDGAAQSIGHTVEGMAKVSTLQARQVDKTNQTVESLLLSINKVASRAQATSKEAEKAHQASDRGGQAVRTAQANMQKLQQGFHGTVLVIRQLGERSKQIGQIVEVITKIAEETNMLALNTAIEAARAGEAASGFGVVADEVRQLADKTARAAEDIVKIIKDIQTDTTRAVSAVEVGVQQMAEGVDVMNRTGVELDETVKVVWEVARHAEEISRMTQEQSASCQDVRRSMAAVTAAAEENLRASNEALKATSQQTQLTKGITSVSNELSKVTQDLADAVRSFKV